MIRHPIATGAYVLFVLRSVVAGTLRICTEALTRADGTTPCIVELPLRCRTDGEIVSLASSITITPGTLVLGTAAGTDDTPPTLFVHAMFGRDSGEVIADLRDMESRLLRATRGKEGGR